jgi:uncharacterized protein YdhG (YjbR/CyaY superfamily)
MRTDIKTIDEYLALFPPDVQEKLGAILDIVLRHAPDATESISYGMPTFKLYGKVLLHFAAYEKHIGFYAIPNTHEAFSEELVGYVQGKGSVQFPLNKSLPLDLIERMVAFRVHAVKG